VANPDVTVEAGTDTYEATATPVSLEERDRIYPVQAALFANFAEYETLTTRKIPVVELTAKS
jgi:deazaflavin-dependent oxidoreductase (nitroreductase family)